LDKVLGRKIYRGKLQHHLQDECKDLTVCETCHGSYRSGVKLEGKDYDHNCVTYLHSLIREIAGEESYNKAVENLLPKAENTESMGTLNEKVAKQLEENAKLIDMKIKNMVKDREAKDNQLDLRLG
jgi:hypothetical protein